MPRLYKSFLLVAILGVWGAAACSSPVAPSGGATVTINGSVVPSSGSASTLGVRDMPGPALTTIPPGLSVSVDGTNITALVSAAGRFALLNVPPGNAGLRFTAPGVLATITLSDLQAGQLASGKTQGRPGTSGLHREGSSGGLLINET